MNPTGRPHGPAWFDISTPDAARARHFYQELFSWPVKLIDKTYAPVDTSVSRIAVFTDPDGNRIGLVSR
jgi:predicted enzyme related to lactoylglutathione lyase